MLKLRAFDYPRKQWRWLDLEDLAQSVRGAEIYVTRTYSLDFTDTSLQKVPFDLVQVDTDEIADLDNNQFVISETGLWTYGFSFAFQVDIATSLDAVLSVDGDAWNLVANSGAISNRGSLSAQAIDRFQVGDILSLNIQPVTACEVSLLFSSSPWVMYTYFLGKL